MKFRKITLGMGFGNYWNNTNNIEKSNHVSLEAENDYKKLISMLLVLVKEQQAMIEQQQSDIQEMKLLMQQIKLKADVLLHVEAYQINS